MAIEVPHGPVVDYWLIAASSCMRSIPSSLIACETGLASPAPRTIAGTPMCWVRCADRSASVPSASCCRSRADRIAWSRLAEELKEEQRRLSNRVGEQLWRYYPQMQKVTDDLAAPWFLELWTLAPTPAKAHQLRKRTIEQILKRHRIRRVDADTVLRTLREPAIKVADGVAEAASIHLRSLVARLRVVSRELREVGVQLDKLCMIIGKSEATSGDCLRRQDVLILRSMPGIGRINLAALLCEASGPLGAVIIRPCRRCVGLLR